MAEKRIELIIPPLGESISEATIARWLKNPGDPVKIDEPIVELETDKVTVNLPAPAAGLLGEQHFPIGSVVRVGASIGVLVSGSTATAPPAASPPASAKTPDPAKGKSDSKSTPAAKPAAEAKPAEKAEAKPAEKAEAKPAADTKAAAPKAEAAKPAAPSAQTAQTTGEHASGTAPISTNSPAMRQWRREHGVDPAAALFAQSKPAPKESARPEAGEQSPLEEVVTMSPLRRRIAERLVEAQHTAAILTTFNEVDMSQIMALRQKHQDDFTKKHGVKLGFMSFFVVACARSLIDFPGLNAEVRRDEAGGMAVAYKKHYDFGIAVGGGKGLVVPVLRDVEMLSFAAIEKGIAELAVKAKENKLTLDELRGGTFSISNGGIYGSMMSTPLLNLPQTGILGMHNIVKRPIAVGDEVQIRPMMYVALSYDHRAVDGREAVSFLVKVKERLEQPDRLLFGL